MSLGDKRSLRLVSRAAKAAGGLDSDQGGVPCTRHAVPAQSQLECSASGGQHDDLHEPLLSYLALQRLESLKHFEVEYHLDAIDIECCKMHHGCRSWRPSARN